MIISVVKNIVTEILYLIEDFGEAYYNHSWDILIFKYTMMALMVLSVILFAVTTLLIIQKLVF